MKLTLTRREKAAVEGGCIYYVASADIVKALPEGMTLYYLDVELEATPEELALIEKNNWGAIPLCKGGLRGVSGTVNFDVSDMLGTSKYAFDLLDNLANVENQLIESVNKFKQLLGDFASGGMSDAIRQLAELYQRVVQDELGLVATIAEDGDVLFDHPEMGGFFVSLSAERDPEHMKLMLPAFFDATRGVSRNDLVQICNRINSTAKLASLTVHEDTGGSVSAWVGLLLAAPDTRPDEALLRAVIGRAVASIKSVGEAFFAELEKIE
jgi:hypothetical protein